MIHLAPLKKEYPDLLWSDSNTVGAGNNINQSLQVHLNAAIIIVLLISPEYLASQDCREQEMQPALALAAAKAVRVIPVLLSSIMQQDLSPFAQYKSLPPNGVPVRNWHPQDDALLEVAEGIRLVIEELADSRTPDLHITPRQTFIPKISFPSNHLFTDRDTILDKISSSFAAGQNHSTPILALNGIAGMGKTQIAQAYSSRSSRYQHIFWLNASSRALLSKDVGSYAMQFSLRVKDDKNEEQLFGAFQLWLTNRPSWLLVLDHVEDINLIDLVVPSRSQGHVLLTMRTQATYSRAFPISVASMDTDSGALFLLRRATLLSIQESLDEAPADLAQDARTITRELDGFPLALDQAGAYIEETGCNLSAYLTLYRQKGLWLLGQGRQAANHQHKSVMGTFELIFEQFARKPGANLDLLHLLAFLHPDFISEELLEKGSAVLRGPLRALVTDAQALHQAFAALLSFSLIYRSSEHRAILQMHRLVQRVLIDKLPKGQQRRWATLVVRLVNHVFPVVSFKTWEKCQRYLPHAQHCADLISHYELTLKEGALLLERLGFYRFQQAAYDDAETYLEQALELYKEHLQADTLDEAQTINSLAMLHSELAHYQEAEKLHERARELREQELNAEHPKTVESLHNIATVYEDRGEYKKAENCYLHVLELEERSKGPDHPDVARTLNNLAGIYFYQKRYSEAETAYQRALTIYQRSPLADERDQIHSLDGLGSVAEQQGNLQRAEQFYEQALAISMKTWGENHPETAHSLNKLAGLSELRSDNERAEKLYQQALAIVEQKLEPEHPDVVLILNNMAFLANKQRQYQRADELYQRILIAYEQTQEMHPDMALVLNNVAKFYRNIHNEKQVEEILRRALAIQQQFLDPIDPDITLNLNTLADVLIDQKRDEEAAPLLQRAFAILLLGTASSEHPNIESVRGKYASLLERLHRDEEAREVRQRNVKQEGQPSTELDPDDH
jgi:tetratricopeptide (TPR) repeat protein